MRYCNLRGCPREFGERTQRRLYVIESRYVDIFQVFGILPILRIDLHDDVVLIQRRVHGRDLALAEGVVKSAIDRLGSDSEPGGCLPIDVERGFEAAIL